VQSSGGDQRQRHAPAGSARTRLPAARARQSRQLDDAALARGWQKRVGRSRWRISMCQKRVLITPTKRCCGRVQSAMGQTTCKWYHVTAASLGSYITVTQLLDSRTRPSNASPSLQHAVAANAPACDWLPWVIHCDEVIVLSSSPLRARCPTRRRRCCGKLGKVHDS
jgi:hypothetical protein